jgi:hypothetical protein
MALPQFEDRGVGLQMWIVAVNIMNKQSRTAESDGPPSWAGGRGANNSSPYKSNTLQNVSKLLGPGPILWHLNFRIPQKKQAIL